MIIFQTIRNNFTLQSLCVNEVNMNQEIINEAYRLEDFSSGHYSPGLICTGSSRDQRQQEQNKAEMVLCSQ